MLLGVFVVCFCVLDCFAGISISTIFYLQHLVTHSDVSDTHSDSGGRTNMTMGLLKIVLFFSLQQLNNKKGVKCFAQGHTIKIIIQSIGFSSTKDRVNAMYDQLG